MRTLPNTPGFLGYVFAFTIGVLVFTLLTVPFADPRHVDAFDALALAGYMTVYASFFFAGIPILLLVLVVWALHRAVRVHEAQRTHVLTAATAGLALAMLLQPVAEQWTDRVLLLVCLPASMAIGRAVVIPMVGDRRSKAGRG